VEAEKELDFFAAKHFPGILHRGVTARAFHRIDSPYFLGSGSMRGLENFLGSGLMRAEHQQLTMIPVHFA
jgi:hypothetical protein